MQVIPGRPGSRAERHPRASATPEITKVTVHCGVSASTGSVGRRRCPAPVPTTWTSTTPGSSRRISSTVRTVFSCVASRCRWALQPGLSGEKRRVSQFGLPHPVKPQPSRGESISFLSPAQAAGAPTFCDATESRQRTQPRGLRPLGHPPLLPELGRNNSSKTPGGRGFQLRCLREEGKNEATEPHRSHAPEPPPATGATSAGSVLPALAPGRGISAAYGEPSAKKIAFGRGVTKARAAQWAAVPRLPHRSWPPIPAAGSSYFL